MTTNPSTNAPKPIIPLRPSSTALLRSDPPIVLPMDLPPHYYQNNIEVKAKTILSRAAKKFPLQAQVFNFCKYVISELCGLQESDLSSVEELLRYILIANCRQDGRRETLEQEIQLSDEWAVLLRKLEIRSDLAKKQTLSSDCNNDANVASIASRLRELLTKCKWTKYKLIDKVGMAKRSVYGHLEGTIIPKEDSLKAYADVFSYELNSQITIDYLRNG